MPLDTPGAEKRLTIIVLAGGYATRLPGKLALPVNGEPMLVRVVRALSATGEQCIVAANDLLPAEFTAQLAARIVYDDRPGEGPLAALASAVAKVTTPYFFAAAGDMPGIDAAFVARIVAVAQAADWPDAVIPAHADGTLEPLAALYKAAPWLASARKALAIGRRNVTAALDGLRTVHYPIVPEDEPALANVNTPGDYESLRSAWAARERRT